MGWELKGRSVALVCALATACMFPGVSRAAPMTSPNTTTAQPAVEPPSVEAVAAPTETEPELPLPVAAPDVVTLPAPSASPATWASFLKQVAPAIAKVGCRATWFTGFVFHSRKHILTTRQALNNDCDLNVRFKDGKARAARVVAWSDEDSLAILELKELAPSEPLPLTRDLSALHAIGESLATVAATTNYMSLHKKGSWLPPRLRFATLSAFEAEQVLFDLPVSYSDMGAPVFAPDGRVVAIIVGAYAGAGPARAVTSQRIEHLRGSIGKQGKFTRPDQFGTTAGVLATPFSTRDLLGASFYSGGTYGRLALVLNIGLYRSGVSLVAATVSDRLTALRIEPELTVRVYGKPGDYWLLGGGLTYEALVRDRRSLEQGSEKSETHLFRPFLSTSVGAGIGQLRIGFWPLKPAPEVRIDIGFAVGR